ncbi:MAG: hypothetical protein Q4E84_08230 [Clostridia bacterium]|nr:hypothetical protein [Clostridia bacterium]MDO5303863.1 hypothetical protein [Clostridia bacterium]
MMIVTFALFNTIIVYGAEWSDAGRENRPLYEETVSYYADFNIDSNGNAEIKGNLKLLGSSAADKVSAVVKITNTTTGKVVYNKTITMTYSKETKRYKLNEKCQLTSKGKYCLNITYKCYDGSRLLESIQVPAKLKSYS